MLGLDFVVDPADIPEVKGADETPRAYVERLAREKAAAVSARHPDAIVLAGDTTVVLDDEILEKPEGVDGATAMLMRLSGRARARSRREGQPCPQKLSPLSQPESARPARSMTGYPRQG